MIAFKKPVPKRCRIPLKPPLPIFESWNLEVNAETCPRFSGIFTALNVIVSKREDVVELYTKGYFGKGSLSHGFPSFDERKRKRKEYEEEQGIPVTSDQRTNDEENVPALLELTDDVQCAGKSVQESEESTRDTALQGINDDDQHADEIVQEDEALETLHLTLEEAFFLSFGLECLNIYRDDTLINTTELWTLFQKTQPYFVEHYVTYHHFRAKGWVVKPGIKFGGDFLLYKQGPPHYHASYVVIIVSNVNEMTMNLQCSALISFNRVGEASRKELVICQVYIPEDFDYENLHHLRRCEVSEFLVNRWDPGENRVAKK